MLEKHHASTRTKTWVAYGNSHLACVYSYCRQCGSLLLYLCVFFPVLVNSLVGWFCISALGLVLFQIYYSTPCHLRKAYKSPWLSGSTDDWTSSWCRTRNTLVLWSTSLGPLTSTAPCATCVKRWTCPSMNMHWGRVLCERWGIPFFVIGIGNCTWP